MNADDLTTWLESGSDPSQFPQIPSDGPSREAFLDEIAKELWNLPSARLEELFGVLPGLLKGRIGSEDFNRALHVNRPSEAEPLTHILIGELGLDFLILDENWNLCVESASRLIEIAEENDLSEEITILLNYRGVCSYRLLKYIEARDDLEESLRLAEEQGNNRMRARASINLGLVYKDMGQLEEAAGHYKIALKLAKEENDKRTVLASYLNIGNIYRELKRWQEGRSALESGIALANELGDTLEEIRGRLNLGVLFLEEGREVEKAADLFQQVIDEAGESGAGQLEWIARSDLGLALLKLGRIEESVEESKRCRDHASTANDSDALWRADSNLAKGYRALGNVPDAERSYKRAISEFDGLRRMLKTDRDRSEFQRNLDNLQEEFVLFSLEASGPEVAFARLARSKGRALSLAFEQLSDARAGIDDEAAFLSQLQTVLSSMPDSIIVDYFVSGDTVRAFVCDQVKVTVHEIPTSLNRISELLKLLSSEINLFIASGEYRQAQIGRSIAPPEIFRRLYEALIEPLSARIQDAKHVIVVPMGQLHQVPFLALADSSNRYFVESHAVSILPSSDFLLTHEDRTEAEIRKLALIRGSEKGLSGSEVEFKALKGLFGSRMKEIDLGSIIREAGIDGLAKELHGSDIIHFLGHAEFDQENPYSSALILPNGDRLRFSDFETSALDLRGVRLVTLAACETGRGKIVAGDEVIGIGRGFLRSGAAAVVASLWKVSDEIVAQFIPLFYQALLAGKSPAHALREAVVELLRRKRFHPYFFAPFQIYGIG